MPLDPTFTADFKLKKINALGIPNLSKCNSVDPISVSANPSQGTLFQKAELMPIIGKEVGCQKNAFQGTDLTRS